MAEIIAVCTSKDKNERKINIGESYLVKNKGLEGDAHAGFNHRQVSLLAEESIETMIAQGLEVGPGDFAENLTTEGVLVWKIPVGGRIMIGENVLGEVTQIGKECHDRCAIFQQVGDCVMPREGIFIRVIEGGEVRPGDSLRVLP